MYQNSCQLTVFQEYTDFFLNKNVELKLVAYKMELNNSIN